MLLFFFPKRVLLRKGTIFTAFLPLHDKIIINCQLQNSPGNLSQQTHIIVMFLFMFVCLGYTWVLYNLQEGKEEAVAGGRAGRSDDLWFDPGPPVCMLK